MYAMKGTQGSYPGIKAIPNIKLMSYSYSTMHKQLENTLNATHANLEVTVEEQKHMIEKVYYK